MNMFKLFDLFKKNNIDKSSIENKNLIYRRFSYFEKLLASNNKALELIANLEDMIFQDIPFTFSHALGQTESLIKEVFSMIKDLNTIADLKYEKLFEVAENISLNIMSELKGTTKILETSLTLSLESLSHESVEEVGGKAANLGEILNRVQLPVPQGFVITASAYQMFMKQNNLNEWIQKKLHDLDVNDTQKLIVLSQEIRSQILKAEAPEELIKAISQAAEDLRQTVGQDLRLAVRSSATSEDSEASFAGQHQTVLNVSQKKLIPAYKEVLSSTFYPRAIFYRRNRGYHDQDILMSVACILMVDAKVSGIMYTVDPNDSRNAVVMISALWGLAARAVEGAANTDYFQIQKETGKIEITKIAEKKDLLNIDAVDGLKEEPVKDQLKNIPCLSPSQIQLLIDHGLRLEKHYGYALDIEWAIDQKDRLYIIQARPLRRSQRFGSEVDPKKIRSEKQAFPEHPVLLEGGISASNGVAAGLAYVLKSDHNIHHIPGGAILVAQNTSPRYVPLMGRIQAIITDVGSVTGHMAAVAREFRLPTLVGTGNATEIIPHGKEITVDASNRVVYSGLVEPLLMEKQTVNPMKGSPIYKKVQSVLKKISPLNLTNPRRENFSPDCCKTLHDLLRFAHEKAMQEMFRFSEGVENQKHTARPLQAYLPFKIYVIDLGNGLSCRLDAKETTCDDIASIPFQALLNGMTHKGVDWTSNAGATFRGFGSLLAESVIRDPLKEGNMGGPNYAIIGSNYLNFNVRIGYHFAIIDTYCGPNVNDNYINFYFKGGAADFGRRSRRALLLSLILKRMYFKVELTGDMVRAELKKFEKKVLEKKLNLMGRLLGAVNLLDQLLSDKVNVEWYVEQFFKENYSFKPTKE
jgi:pyruvate,water dikinase